MRNKFLFAASLDESLSEESLNQLVFLDRFMKETFRLYPPLPIIARHLDEPAILREGFTVFQTSKRNSFYHSLKKFIIKIFIFQLMVNTFRTT